MKELLVSRKGLTYYHVKKPGKIQVDLSKSGIGAALLQNDRPTAYASKFQTAKQQRYALAEQEMLVLVFGHQTIHQCTVLSSIILYCIILYYIILYIYIYHVLYITYVTVQNDNKPFEVTMKKSLQNTPSRFKIAENVTRFTEVLQQTFVLGKTF